MVLRTAGEGRRVEYALCSYWAQRVEWVSRRTDDQGRPAAVRVPQERAHTFPAVAFFAAGRFYVGWKQLVEKQDEEGVWCRDVYGRQVLTLTERFPCFDSYDFAHENRRYRWFFLREGEKLTRVFYTDGRAEISVTEDVANLEDQCWREMERLGYFQ